MGLVKSIERFVFDIDNTTNSGSLVLGKSQVVANCVPFFTTRADHSTGYYQSEMMSEVYFEGNNVVAKLGGTLPLSSNQTSVCTYVVEFDPTYAEVQSGTFSMTTSETDTTISGAAFDTVDLDKTFLMFSYSPDADIRNFRDSLIKGKFANDSSIYFERYDLNQNISGRWFTVEALNNSFSVSSVDIGITSGNRRANVDFSEQRNPNKSFILYSYKTNNSAGQDADYYAASARLVGQTAFVRRSNVNGSLDGHMFRITLNGKGQRVQRYKHHSTTNATSYTFKIDNLNSNLLMPHIPTFFGINHSTDDDADDIPRIFHQITAVGQDACQEISGIVTSSGVINPENAFDGDTATSTTMSGSIDSWVQYEFPTATGVDTVRIYNNGAAANTPYRIQGSATGSFTGEEVTLMTRFDTTLDGVGIYNIHPFENKNSYKYYRFVNDHTTALTLGSIEFYNSSVPNIDKIFVGKKRVKNSDCNCELIDWKEYNPYKETKLSSTETPVLSVEHITCDYNDTRCSSFELSKNQNPDYCVPFLTSYQETQAVYSFANYLSDVRFGEDGDYTKLTLQRCRNTPVNHSAISVVEFDPAQVKVQQGTFGISYNNVSVTISGSEVLDTFDRNKTFLIFNYSSYLDNIQWGRAMVQGYIPNNDSITFERGDLVTGYEEVVGSWYLVESITDWFEVEHFYRSGSITAPIKLPLSDPVYMDKVMLVSSFRVTNLGGIDTDYYAIYTYMENPQEIEVGKSNNSTTVNALVVSVSAIKFNTDKMYPYVYRYFNTTAADTGTATYYNYNTISYDEARTTVRTPVFFGINSSADDDADDVPRSFVRYTVSGTNGDKVVATSWMGKVQKQNFELIDWGSRTLPTHHFSGDVKEIEDPVERTVRAYRADTGELVGTTTSVSGTGVFDVTTTYSGAHYVVCLDDPEGVDYNDLIYGSVIPDAI